MCAVALLENMNGAVSVRREVRFFKGHEDVDKAYHWGMRWTAGVENHVKLSPTVNYGGNEIKITLFAGIAIYPGHGKNGEELILCADEMLYQSKHSGRNQVSIA